MINEQEVRQFYRFFGHKNPTEVIVFDKVRYPEGRVLWAKDEQDFVNKVRQFNEKDKVDAYIGGRDRIAKGDKGIVSSYGLFIEIDEHDAKKPEQLNKLKEFLASKSIEIGMLGFSGGGYHVYAPSVLKELQTDLDREELRQGLDKFKQALLSAGIDIDSACFDLQRVSRVLGTFNYKRNEMSKIVYYNPDVNLEKNRQAIIDLLSSMPKETEIKSNQNALEILEKYKINLQDKWLYELIKNKIIIPEDSGANSKVFKNAALILVRDNFNKDEIKIVGKALAELCTGRTLTAFMGWIRKALVGEISEVNQSEINTWIDEKKYPLSKYEGNLISAMGKDTGFEVYSDADIMNYEPEKQLWLIENQIPKGEVGILAGKRGDKKTWTALYQAICIAAGINCFGDKV
jgi:hypothetical protein